MKPNAVQVTYFTFHITLEASYQARRKQIKSGGQNFLFQCESTIFQNVKVKVKKASMGGGCYVNVIIFWQF